jgi:prepilin-type N-terminal cleavage/methylation domain-containing protein/prepilin-type processing-associated H-X9-DG protein
MIREPREHLSSHRAFTLLELLVVVAIIGILAAILFPVLKSVRDRGRAARCVSNLKQIGLAFQMYTQENDDTLPQRFYGTTLSGKEFGYDELLLPYVGGKTNIFTCPSVLKTDYPDQPTYGMNWYLDNTHLNWINQPSESILVAEAAGTRGVGSHRADRDSLSPGQLNPSLHQKKANYLFLDGHVSFLGLHQTVDYWSSNFNRHLPTSNSLPD